MMAHGNLAAMKHPATPAHAAFRSESRRPYALLGRMAPAMLAGLLSALGAACAGALPPPPIPVSRVPAPARTPEPPPLPARWLESSGHALIGPTLPEGTLVLLGGRRALVAPDGTVLSEKALSPEPLYEIIAVPTASGPRVLGRGMKGIYRFDDPLGPATVFARLDKRGRLGAAPGILAVWLETDPAPVFLNVDTGQPATLPGPPRLPLRDIAFRDMREGAAVFHAVGLAVTADGGATWHLASDGDSGASLNTYHVRWTGAAIHAYDSGPAYNARGGSTKASPIDVRGKRVGPLGPWREVDGEALLLRWLRTTGQDPLSFAARHGIAAPGGVIVAGSGAVARFDPRTGAVLEMKTFGGSDRPDPACSTARAGTTAWLGCPLANDPADARSQVVGEEYPFGILRLALDRPELELELAMKPRKDWVDIRTSPAGGVMFGPCHDTGGVSTCVRQPNGDFAFVPMVGGWLSTWERTGAAPLSDGRMAILRGHFDENYRSGQHESDQALVDVRLEACNTEKKTELIARVPLGTGFGIVRVQSPIEELEDGRLRLVLELSRDERTTLHVVTVPPGSKMAELRQIPGALHAKLHGRHGIAAGSKQMLVSRDGGESWAEVPAPKSALESLGSATLSDVGVWFSSGLFRVGWGPPEPLPARPDLAATQPLATLPGPPAEKSARLFACTTLGVSSSPTPPLIPDQARKLLATATPPPVGTRRVIDALKHMILEREGPATPSSILPTWRLRWHDPAEMGGKPRTWTGPNPTGVGSSPSMITGAISGNEATFAVNFGFGQAQKTFAVRVRPNSAAEVADVTGSFDTRSHFVPGAGEGDPTLLVRGAALFPSLFAWAPGTAPRAIASFVPWHDMVFDPPTSDSITARIGLLAWVIPIPPSNAPPAAPVRAALGDWRPVNEQAVDALPVCAASATGPRRWQQSARVNAEVNVSLRTEVDGEPAKVHSALYEIRGAGAAACLAGATVTLVPSYRPSPAAGLPKGVRLTRPLTLIRADFRGKRAEAILYGDRPSPVQRLRCELK